MKKLIIFFCLFSFNFSVNAQKIFYDEIILFPLLNKTQIAIDNKKSELKDVLIVSNSSQIDVVSGKICVLDLRRDEFIFKQGENFKLIKNSNKKSELKKSITLNKLSTFIEKPSVYMPFLYSTDRNEIDIFPLMSKVCDPSSITIYCYSVSNNQPEFKLFEKNSENEILLISGFKDSISLKNVSLCEGKDYTWRIYSGSSSCRGEFRIIDKSAKEEIVIPELLKMENYLEAFFNYLDNQCYFDAMAIIREARRAFPQSETIKLIYMKFPFSRY